MYTEKILLPAELLAWDKGIKKELIPAPAVDTVTVLKQIQAIMLPSTVKYNPVNLSILLTQAGSDFQAGTLKTNSESLYMRANTPIMQVKLPLILKTSFEVTTWTKFYSGNGTIILRAWYETQTL